MLNCTDSFINKEPLHSLLGEKVEVDLTPKMPNIKVFSGSSHPDLARRLVGKDNCILEILFLVGLTTIPRGASLFLIS